MSENKLIMAHIQLPIQIIDNMIEPLQDYLHISFAPCDALPERTNCDLQTALSDKIKEYLEQEQEQEQEQDDSTNTNETPDNASQYITLEELSKKKRANHHKHSTFKKYPKYLHNISCKRRFTP